MPGPNECRIATVYEGFVCDRETICLSTPLPLSSLSKRSANATRPSPNADYVIAMLMELYGYSKEKGFLMAKEVDTRGRVVVLTTTKEHAELKRDQIHAYGKDAYIAACKGSMKASIEPVPGE